MRSLGRIAFAEMGISPDTKNQVNSGTAALRAPTAEIGRLGERPRSYTRGLERMTNRSVQNRSTVLTTHADPCETHAPP